MSKDFSAFQFSRFAAFVCGLTLAFGSALQAQDGIVIEGTTGIERDELRTSEGIEAVRSIEAERMQAIGDSLLHCEKPIAALAMFRGVEKRTFEPCQLAQAFRGIAQVQARTLNIAEARSAADESEIHLGACGAEQRIALVQALAEVRIHLGQEEAAERLVRNELKLHPNRPELRALIARIAFIQGNWYATQEAVDAVYESIEREGVTDQNLAWLKTMSTQSFILEHLSFPDSIQNELKEALANLELESQIKHREDVLNILQKQPTLALEALEWAKATRDLVPRSKADEFTLASLGVAKCAMRASVPSLAMLAFHDALNGAERTGNPWLLAEVLRQQAAYYVARKDPEQAIASYRSLDSVNVAIAINFTDQSNRPLKHFTQNTLSVPDLFEQGWGGHSGGAVINEAKGWPWAVALLSVGLLAMALFNREMRKNLRLERSRIIRLRSLIPSGIGGSQDAPHSVVEANEATRSDHDAAHDRVGVAVGPEWKNYQAIASFLQELDQELACPITWDLAMDVNLAINSEVQHTLRALLMQFKVWADGKTPINVQVEQHELEWKFSVTSDHTNSSRELSTLFAGKSAGVKGWQGLYDQLQRLAARVVIERLNTTQERLTITLPLGH